MNLRFITCIFTLAIFTAVTTGCDSSSSSTGPSGSGVSNITGFYYSFDETGSVITDYSGNNYDGSPSSISRVPGKVGNAVQFLGQGSSIDLNSIAFPFKSGVSLRAWIKIDQAVTTRQQILGGSTGSNSSAAFGEFGMSLINDSISLEIPAQQNVILVTTNPLTLPIDTWFHIAITYDGDAVSFYYNGNLVGTDSILTTFGDFFQNQQIGNNQRIFGGVQIEDQFLGFIDELYLENKILTQGEIAAYYASTM